MLGWNPEVVVDVNPTFPAVIECAHRCWSKLNSIRTSGENKTIRDDVQAELLRLKQALEIFSKHEEQPKQPTDDISQHLKSISENVQELKATLRQPSKLEKDLKEIKAAIQPVKSWAEVAKASAPEILTKHDI